MFCYGLPLTLVVILSTALARAVKRSKVPARRQFFARSVLRVLGRTWMFLFLLLLQGYLVIYLVNDLAGQGALQPRGYADRASFAVSDSILATQLGLLGGLVLLMDILFIFFVVPLHLFRETPLAPGWHSRGAGAHPGQGGEAFQGAGTSPILCP